MNESMNEQLYLYTLTLSTEADFRSKLIIYSTDYGQSEKISLKSKNYYHSGLSLNSSGSVIITFLRYIVSFYRGNGWDNPTNGSGKDAVHLVWCSVQFLFFCIHWCLFLLCFSLDNWCCLWRRFIRLVKLYLSRYGYMRE